MDSLWWRVASFPVFIWGSSLGSYLRERERESLLLLDFSLDASHARVAQFTLK